MRALFLRLVRLPIRRLVLLLRFRREGVFVAKGSFIEDGVKIGRKTRINSPSYIEASRIGAYCAIGGRLVVRSRRHSINYANVQGWAQKYLIGSSTQVNGISDGPVVIGNACWIGDSVLILPNVVVGNGAVIGAGSVVTRSVPAYAVAYGNPARVARYRFSSEVIDFLEEVRWWLWDDGVLKKNMDFFEIDFTEVDENGLMELRSKYIKS